MNIHSAALIGAGAVGSYFTDCMCGRKDLNFCILAEGKRAEQLKENGMTVNGHFHRVSVKSPEEARGVDFILVARKYNSLRNALPMIRTAADEHTLIMSVMNGLDSEEIIAEVVPADQIIYSLIRIGARHNEDGSFHYDPMKNAMGVYFGEKDGNNDTERIKAVLDLFTRTGVKFCLSGDILKDIWTKFAENVSLNIPQAILGVDAGAYVDSRHVAAVQDGLWHEVIALARVCGVNVPAENKATRSIGTAFPKSCHFSTLQDLDARRSTEIDMFCGTVVRLAEKYHIPAPYNQMCYHLIKALEEKNEGKFAYK